MRKRRICWLASCIISALACVLLAMSLDWHRDYRAVIRGSLVGNQISSLGVLKEKGFPFSFLVMGDSHATNRGVALIRKAIKEGPSAFMIILGDFVSQPDIRYHHYFAKRLAEEIQPPFPVFLVPGNHDIDYGASREKVGPLRVTPEQYESLYGSRYFSFIYNDCLFIICGIDGRNKESHLNFLRGTLSQKGEGRKFIFVFMHQPPTGIGIPDDYPFPGQEEFFSLLETYGVTACFFGDYHAYWRVQRKGTDLIVSGGGGGSLKKYQPGWGKFHHLLRITVDENGFSEGVMILPGTVIDIQGTLKKWMFIHFFPIIQKRGWVLYLLLLCFLSWGLFSVIMIFRLSKRKKLIVEVVKKG